MSRQMTHDDVERFAAGLLRLEEDGQAGQKVIDALAEVAPVLARYIFELAFSDTYRRPILDLRQRQLVTIAVLTSQGATEPQLEVHVNGGLNVGLSPAAIVEAMVRCVPYVGFPRVLNAIFVAQRVFSERGGAVDAGARSDEFSPTTGA